MIRIRFSTVFAIVLIKNGRRVGDLRSAESASEVIGESPGLSKLNHEGDFPVGSNGRGWEIVLPENFV
jgi:hypothetical protein